MFKKRVKSSNTLLNNSSLEEPAQIPITPLPESPIPDSFPLLENDPISNKAFITIPNEALYKKTPQFEETAFSTPAEIEKNKRLTLQLEKNYLLYDDSELLLKKKGHCKSAINIDFNPTICKDFHDNGYCSWGVSCLYAHDRTDYKRGWELDAEWEKEQLAKLKAKKVNKTELAKVDECFLCKSPYSNPVQTKCKHIFCETCIFKAFKISKNCPVCKLSLNGIFNAVITFSEPNKINEKNHSDKNFSEMSNYLKPISVTRPKKFNDDLQNADFEPVIVNKTEFEKSQI